MAKCFKSSLIIIISLLLTECSPFFAEEQATLINKVQNPSKTKQVILFLKEGSAVTDNFLQVSVKDIDDDLNKTETGNSFTADSNHSNLTLDSTAIKLTWKDDTHLNIAYHNKLRTFKKVNNVNGIAITYQKF